MSQHQPVEAIDAARPEIAAQNAFEIPFAARVEKPVGSCAPQMHGGAFIDIQHGDFGVSAIGPARPLEINMAGRSAGEQLDGAENQPGESSSSRC